MKIANLKQAQAKLDELIEAARRGEEVFIARRTTVVAQIVPLGPSTIGTGTRRKRQFGVPKGKTKPHPKKK